MILSDRRINGRQPIREGAYRSAASDAVPNHLTDYAKAIDLDVPLDRPRDVLEPPAVGEPAGPAPAIVYTAAGCIASPKAVPAKTSSL